MKFLVFLFLLLNTSFVFANSSSMSKSSHKQSVQLEKLKPRPWTRFYSYVPEKMEYNFELGSMWEANNLYWLGGSMGFHIGRCMFSQSHSCQQFADFIGGAGGRSGFTNGVLFSSLRWQFTDLKDYFVTHSRVLVGAIKYRDDIRDRTVFSYGVGYGVTAAVHPRLDLKFEVRGGYGDRAWSQSFISFSLKFEKFIDYFAKKLDNLGAAGRLVKGTAEFTGKIIKGTVETTGKVIQKTMETTSDVIEKGAEKTNEMISSPKTEKIEPKDELEK